MAVQLVSFTQQQTPYSEMPIPTWDVTYENRVKIGEIGKEVDGFYYFWPELNGGCWDSTVMKLISDQLDKMNRPWQEQIDRDHRIRGEGSRSSSVLAASSDDINLSRKAPR